MHPLDYRPASVASLFPTEVFSNHMAEISKRVTKKHSEGQNLNVQRMRIARGWSQKDLASKLHVKEGDIQRFEKGTNRSNFLLKKIQLLIDK